MDCKKEKKKNEIFQFKKKFQLFSLDAINSLVLFCYRKEKDKSHNR
jgi:hypothetical protein